MALEVANEILNQLGGKKFLAMTGCYNLVADNNTLRMRLRRNKANATHFEVVLNSDDTYNIRFAKVIGVNYTPVKMVVGVYSDMLQSIFTEVTGLYTSL